MKKKMIAVACAAAFGLSVFGMDWFDGGIAEGWPGNSIDGVWDNMTGTTFVKENVGGHLDVSAPVEAPLTFAANEAKRIEEYKSLTVKSKVTFTPFLASALPDVPATARTAVILVKEADESLKYYVLAYDQDKKIAEWQRDDTFVGTVKEEVEVTIVVSPDGQASYFFDDVEGITCQIHDIDGKINAVKYSGEGAVSSLHGSFTTELVPDVKSDNASVSFEDEVKPNSEMIFTVTPDEGYQVMGVKVDGIEIFPEDDGKYHHWVEEGTEYIEIVVTAAPPAPPSAYTESFEEETQASMKAVWINDNIGTYVAAPAGSPTTPAYLALFSSKVAYNAQTSLYDVTIGLSDEGAQTLQAEADTEIAGALGDGTISTIPGLYYTFVGGVELDKIATDGTKTLAKETSETIPKPALGETDKAFYRLRIETK